MRDEPTTRAEGRLRDWLASGAWPAFARSLVLHPLEESELPGSGLEEGPPYHAVIGSDGALRWTVARNRGRPFAAGRAPVPGGDRGRARRAARVLRRDRGGARVGARALGRRRPALRRGRRALRGRGARIVRAAPGWIRSGRLHRSAGRRGGRRPGPARSRPSPRRARRPSRSASPERGSARPSRPTRTRGPRA